jgi:hypothetical protein
MTIFSLQQHDEVYIYIYIYISPSYDQFIIERPFLYEMNGRAIVYNTPC